MYIHAIVCMYYIPHCMCIHCVCVSIIYHMLLYIYTDAAALLFLMRVSIVTGMFERLRDTAARVLPFWEETSPFYPYIIAL